MIPLTAGVMGLAWGLLLGAALMHRLLRPEAPPAVRPPKALTDEDLVHPELWDAAWRGTRE